MKRKYRLIKFLRIACVIGEAFGVIGLLITLFMVPFLEGMVDNRQASVALYIDNGSPGLSFNARLPHSTDGNFSFDRRGMAAGKIEYGNVSFGPFLLSLDPSASSSILRNLNAQGVEINNLEGTITIKEPQKAAEVLASIKWPLVAGMLCMGVAGLLILELFRRMFRSAERDEVFTTANIRNVRGIGYLLIASGILKLITAAWLMNRMGAYVAQHVAAGGVGPETTTTAGPLGVVTGLMVLALAEVFRQGLSLKEENQFTV
jgi:hypothetical protein